MCKLFRCLNMLFTCKLFRCLNMREFTDVWKFENDGAGGRRPVTPCLDLRGRLKEGKGAKMGRRIKENRRQKEFESPNSFLL